MTTMVEQTNTEEYNGWTNRETWAAALHLSNDEYLYETMTEIVESKPDTFQAAEAIRDWVAEQMERVFFPENDEDAPQVFRSMANDVGSWWRVDWTAVAESFKDE